jgi:hypothetical protein
LRSTYLGQAHVLKLRRLKKEAGVRKSHALALVPSTAQKAAGIGEKNKGWEGGICGERHSPEFVHGEGNSAHNAKGFSVIIGVNDIAPDRGGNPEVESLNSKAGALHGVVDCEACTHLWRTRLKGGGGVHKKVL